MSSEQPIAGWFRLVCAHDWVIGTHLSRSKSRTWVTVRFVCDFLLWHSMSQIIFLTVSSNHNDTTHNIVDDFKQTYSSSSGAESRSSRFFFTLPREFRSTIRFVSCVATTTRGSQTKRKFLTLISHLTRATCCFRFQMIKPQSERQCAEEESSAAPGTEHHREAMGRILIDGSRHWRDLIGI